MILPLSGLLSPLGTSRGLTTFSPDQIAGLKVWLKADALALSNGDPVGSFTDVYGHHFIGTGASRPTYIASALAGRPTVRFDAVDDVLSAGNLSTLFPAAATIFLVGTVTLATYNLYSTSGNATFWAFGGVGYQGSFRLTRIDGYPAAMPTSGSRVFSLVSSAARYEMFLNGVSQGVRSASYSAGMSYVLGANGFGVAGADISEVLIYDADLGDADRQAVESYLSSQYGF